MGIDAKTLMLISLGIAVIAGMALLAEARATRERAQWLWGLGFLAIALGCALTPLREGISFRLGVWLADGLLIVAHLVFLFGNARFVGRPVSIGAWMPLLLWLPLAGWPVEVHRSFVVVLLNAASVAWLALLSAAMLWRHAPAGDWASPRLAAVFGAHGLFYAVKAVLVWVPGSIVDIVALKGVIIQLSLVEGIPVETLLLLAMAASVRRRREALLVTLAESDPLTGLLNRRAFDDRAQAMLRRGEAASSGGAVMLCDLDHFKVVNDTHGHAVGDRILVVFADLLRAALPADALIARYGGDEFVALLPDIDGEALGHLAATIRGGFQAGRHAAGADGIATSVTIGTAWTTPGTDLATLLRRADAAAYEAKRRGRDQVFIQEVDSPSRATRHAPAPRRLHA